VIAITPLPLKRPDCKEKIHLLPKRGQAGNTEIHERNKHTFHADKNFSISCLTPFPAADRGPAGPYESCVAVSLGPLCESFVSAGIFLLSDRSYLFEDERRSY